MNIYVGNLPYEISAQDLENLFGPFGTVISVKIITDRQTGRSKGFGFVELEGQAEAREAIAKLNGSEVGGRKLVVSEARPRPQL